MARANGLDGTECDRAIAELVADEAVALGDGEVDGHELQAARRYRGRAGGEAGACGAGRDVTCVRGRVPPC
jgi:hypothetical protein